MKFLSILRLSASFTLLLFGLLSGQCANAFNPFFPDARITTLLTPQQGQTLLTLVFQKSAVFGKPLQSQKVSFWKPTQAESVQAQAALYDYVQKSAEIMDAGSSSTGFRPYYVALTEDIRQFAGVTQGVEKRILINGFAASDEPNFVTALGYHATVADPVDSYHRWTDGGSSFRAVYDPKTNRIVSLVYDRFVEGPPASHKGPPMSYNGQSFGVAPLIITD